MNEIQCTSFKPVEGSYVKGFASIYIPKWGVEIFNISLFEKEGRRWINLPSREYEKDGEKKFLPLLRFREKEHAELFGEKVKQAIDKFLGTNPQEIQEEIPF